MWATPKMAQMFPKNVNANLNLKLITKNVWENKNIQCLGNKTQIFEKK
jgi:hypothetical protein